MAVGIIDEPGLAFLPDGLVGYWTFDEGIATDWSGKGNNGILVANPPLKNGVIGKALSFNGTSQYVDTGTRIAPASLSVFMWANLRSTATSVFAMQHIISVGCAWQFFQAGGAYYCRIHQGDTGAIFIGRTGGTVATDKWLHIGFTWLGGTSTSGIKIYVNALQIDTADSNAGAFTSGNTTTAIPFFIGAQYYSSAAEYLCNGDFDDVCAYKRALLQSEITLLYERGAAMLRG